MAGSGGCIGYGDPAQCEQVKRYVLIQHRSVPKQIEYGSQIGKIAEENPELPFSMISNILIADQEAPAAGGSPGKALTRNRRRRGTFVGDKPTSTG